MKTYTASEAKRNAYHTEKAAAALVALRVHLRQIGKDEWARALVAEQEELIDESWALIQELSPSDKDEVLEAVDARLLYHCFPFGNKLLK